MRISPGRAYASFSCVLFIFLPAVATALDFDDTRERIRAGMVENSVPSVAVAVAMDGEIVWEQGFGWADRESRIPANEHAVYSLASISKPITATGIMLLAQSGQVALDAPANDYLGNARLRAYVGDARQATLRSLADHTSGLPYHHQYFYSDEPYEVPAFDVTMLRYGNVIHAPGRFRYTNLGYGVLSHIIERVSGLSYAEFMRREVFMPLGMTRTSAGIGPGLEDFVATRYGRDGLPVPGHRHDTQGDGSVFASAHDLVRFGLFHLKASQYDQKAILTNASIDEMHRRTARSESIRYQDGGYALGFFVYRRNGHRVVEHGGNSAGVSTQMLLFPDTGLAIVVLANSNSGLPADVADHIAGKLLPDWKPSEAPERPEAAPFVVPEALSGVWKGVLRTYMEDRPLELRFMASDEVHARLGDQPVMLVDKPSFESGSFRGRFVGHVGTPEADRSSDRIALELTLREDTLSGEAAVWDLPKGPRSRSRASLSHWVELRRQPLPVARSHP